VSGHNPVYTGSRPDTTVDEVFQQSPLCGDRDYGDRDFSVGRWRDLQASDSAVHKGVELVAARRKAKGILSIPLTASKVADIFAAKMGETRE